MDANKLTQADVSAYYWKALAEQHAAALASQPTRVKGETDAAHADAVGGCGRPASVGRV